MKPTAALNTRATERGFVLRIREKWLFCDIANYGIAIFGIAIFGIAIFGLLGGCGASREEPFNVPPTPVEDPAQVRWNLEQGGIRLLIETTEDLNRTGNLPMGLTMCVYQLKDFSSLQNTVNAPDGIDALLTCRMDTVNGAAGARLFFLQPGQRQEVVMDRLEGARYLAVVAGYAHLRPDACHVVQPFPMEQDREGLLRTKVYSAAPLDALIRLGAESVSITGVKRVQ